VADDRESQAGAAHLVDEAGADPVEALEDALLLVARMPMPRSVTAIATSPSRSTTPTSMARLSPEYLTALSSRLQTTWSIASASTWTGGSGSAGSRRPIVKPAPRTRTAKVSTEPRTTLARSASRNVYALRPDSMREKSRMLLTSWVRRRLSVSMYSPYSRILSGSVTRPSRRNSPNTRIEASGVRSSCETLETKSLFIADSLTSREATRRTSRIAASSATARPTEKATLIMKLRRASSSGVVWRSETTRRQSVKTNDRRLQTPRLTSTSTPPRTTGLPAPSSTVTASDSLFGKLCSVPWIAFGSASRASQCGSTIMPTTPTTRALSSVTGLRMMRKPRSRSSTSRSGFLIVAPRLAMTANGAVAVHTASDSGEYSDTLSALLAGSKKRIHSGPR